MTETVSSTTQAETMAQDPTNIRRYRDTYRGLNAIAHQRTVGGIAGTLYLSNPDRLSSEFNGADGVFLPHRDKNKLQMILREPMALTKCDGEGKLYVVDPKFDIEDFDPDDDFTEHKKGYMTFIEKSTRDEQSGAFLNTRMTLPVVLTEWKMDKLDDNDDCPQVEFALNVAGELKTGLGGQLQGDTVFDDVFYDTHIDPQTGERTLGKRFYGMMSLIGDVPSAPFSDEKVTGTFGRFVPLEDSEPSKQGTQSYGAPSAAPPLVLPDCTADELQQLQGSFLGFKVKFIPNATFGTGLNQRTGTFFAKTSGRLSERWNNADRLLRIHTHRNDFGRC